MNLTELDKLILMTLANRNAYPATYRELADTTGYTRVGVFHAVKRMKGAGLINQETREGRNVYRSIHITRRGLEALAHVEALRQLTTPEAGQ